MEIQKLHFSMLEEKCPMYGHLKRVELIFSVEREVSKEEILNLFILKKITRYKNTVSVLKQVMPTKLVMFVEYAIFYKRSEKLEGAVVLIEERRRK